RWALRVIHPMASTGGSCSRACRTTGDSAHIKKSGAHVPWGRTVHGRPHYLTQFAFRVCQDANFPEGALRVCPYRFAVATTYPIPKLTSRREYFRLPYPVTSGAKLAIEGYQYKVGEISERGLRILSDAADFEVDTEVQGTLILTMG